MGRKRMSLKRRRAEAEAKLARKRAPYTEGYEPPSGAPRAADAVTYITGLILFAAFLLIAVTGFAAWIRSI